MTGYNHRSDCICRWCTGGSTSGRRSTSAPKQAAWKARVDYDRLTVPNTACPVCGAAVFYFRNEFGSSVFFDELGPPWPKHPCTDNAPIKIYTRLQEPARSPPALALRDGWIALRLLGIDADEDTGWKTMRCERVVDDSFVRILVSEMVTPREWLPIYMRPWTDEGYTDLEYLSGDLIPRRSWGWQFSKFFAESAVECVRQRFRDVWGINGQADATGT